MLSACINATCSASCSFAARRERQQKLVASTSRSCISHRSTQRASSFIPRAKRRSSTIDDDDDFGETLNVGSGSRSSSSESDYMNDIARMMPDPLKDELFDQGGSDQFDWDMERDLASRGGMRRGRRQAQQTEWDMTADAEELRKFQAEINAWSPEKLYSLYNEAGQEIDDVAETRPRMERQHENELNARERAAILRMMEQATRGLAGNDYAQVNAQATLAAFMEKEDAEGEPPEVDPMPSWIRAQEWMERNWTDWEKKFRHYIEEREFEPPITLDQLSSQLPDEDDPDQAALRASIHEGLDRIRPQVMPDPRLLEEIETARQATIQADKQVDEMIDRLPKSHRERILKKAEQASLRVDPVEELRGFMGRINEANDLDTTVQPYIDDLTTKANNDLAADLGYIAEQQEQGKLPPNPAVDPGLTEYMDIFPDGFRGNKLELVIHMFNQKLAAGEARAKSLAALEGNAEENIPERYFYQAVQYNVSDKNKAFTEDAVGGFSLSAKSRSLAAAHMDLQDQDSEDTYFIEEEESEAADSEEEYSQEDDFAEDDPKEDEEEYSEGEAFIPEWEMQPKASEGPDGPVAGPWSDSEQDYFQEDDSQEDDSEEEYSEGEAFVPEWEIQSKASEGPDGPEAGPYPDL